MFNAERKELQHNVLEGINIRSKIKRVRSPTNKGPSDGDSSDEDMRDGSVTPKPQPLAFLSYEQRDELTELIKTKKGQDLDNYISTNRINVNSPLPLPSPKNLHDGGNFEPVPAVLLDIAASFGDTEIYDKLILLGARVELSSPLQSIVHGQPGIGSNERSESIDHFINILEEKKISINQRQFEHNPEIKEKLERMLKGRYDLMPALHMAVLAGKLDAVQLLMDSGANPNIKSSAGRTAFDYVGWYTGADSKKIRKKLGVENSNP